MLNRNCRALIIALGASVSWGALATAANAQDVDVTTADAEVGEVIVTAQRRSQNVQDVPMSVTALTGEQMDKFQLQNFDQIEELTAGLALERNDRVTTSTLRGVTYDPDTSAAATVDTYINDVPLDPNFALTSIFDVQQIEVLRGPQGSLRGRPAPAGAITMTTRRPNLSSYGGTFGATFTDMDSTNIHAAVNIPLIEDVLAVRLAALYDEQAGNDVFNTVNQEASHRTTRGYRAAVQWQATDNLNFILTHNSLRDDNVIYTAVSGAGLGYNGPATPIRAEDRLSVSDDAARVNMELDLTTLNATYDLPGHQLTYIFGRVEALNSSLRDQDIGNSLPGYASLQSVSSPDMSYSHEVRLQSAGERSIDYVLGVWSHERKTRTTVSQPTVLSGAFGEPGNPIPSAIPNAAYILPVDLLIPTRAKNQAIFGNIEFHLPARTHLSVGGRYFEDARTLEYQQVTGAALNAVGAPCAFVPGGGITMPYGCDVVITPATATSQSHATERAFVYNANLRHDFADNIMGYVSYGTSYRPGSIVVGLTGFVPDDFLFYGSEESKSIEVGFKTDWYDGRLKANIAVYQQTYDDYIARFNAIPYGDRPNQAAGFTYNADAISDGVEIELIAQASDNLSLRLGLAASDARFDDQLVPCRDSNGDGVPDNAPLAPGYNPVTNNGSFVALCRSSGSISDQPNWALNLQAEYRAPMTFIGQPDLQGYVRGLFNYKSEIRDELYTVPGSHNLSIYAGVQSDDGWEFGAFVRNLLGGDELTSDPNGPELVSGGYNSGYIQSNYSRGREIGANLRYRFGRG